MIRVLVYIALLALVAMGLAWLADRPGDIALTWQGWHVKTSVMTGAVALLALVVALMVFFAVLRAVLRSPESMSLFFRTRRRAKGFNAVTRGMIAVGSGDAKQARRQAIEAERILGAEPLALLLRAQAAQLSGDRAGAETAFTAMLKEPETKPLGLRGLFVEARRRGDAKAARLLADEAVKSAPTLPWAATALLEFQSVERDWSGALATLARNADHRLVNRDTARRQRAVLLTARALEEAERDRAAAKAGALEALKLAPGLVPAAVLAARLLSDGNQIRKASKVLETAWRAGPHPDIAQAYMNVRHGDSARDRLARVQTLAAQAPGNPESALALARAALATRDFTLARNSLAPLLNGAATERVYLMMAEIEEAENGATGRVREWLARAVRAPRDPAWTADGMVSDIWLPVSPTTGRIDAFEWKTPVERIGGPIVDPADDVLADIDEPPAQIAYAADKAEAAKLVEPIPVPAPAPLPEPEAVQPSEPEPEPVKPAAPVEKSAAAVPPIPATHPVPDDPGMTDDVPQPRASRFSWR